ncbi:hypothetical protein BGZ63DRAFT_518557 [Mariannaea sp. PMI_226]|nr:hypothetical protein BGZ63DRAFT_518557 [Mariannaea sp. PMI_226]
MASSPSGHGPNRHQWWQLLVLLSFYVVLSIQQKDPIDDFCRRWGHQAAVVDDKLYIDGGLATYAGDSSHKNITNSYLIYHDLSTVASSGMPQPYANLSKNSSIPSLNGGVLWPDTVNKRIYLFGGEFYQETPSDFKLYSYDILNDQWDSYPTKSKVITRLSYGAGLSISSRGEGYYYGGWVNNNTEPGWTGNAVTTSNMLVYDMDSNTWSNNTGPDNVGRAEGVMLYLPAGDGGMIIYFGGIRGTGNGHWVGQPMEEIIIYDILSGKSYTQNATGNVPEMRRRFCAGVSWPDDQSSYNIYLYGGLGQAVGSTGFDDAYVLSIPSFTWTRFYPTDTNKTGPYGHHSLSCNVVNEAQMLIHGGFFPLTNDCDSSDQWGLHNMDLGEQNPDDSPWALWQPNKTSYAVPTPILSVVGGKSTGGATKMEPKGGWDFADLGVLMTRKAEAATRTATRDVPGATSTSESSATSDHGDDDGSSSKLGTGAIVGIAIGSVVVVALLLVGVWFLICRRRSNVGSKKPYDQCPPNEDSIPPPTASPFQTPTSATPYQTPPPPFSDTEPAELHAVAKEATDKDKTPGPRYDAHGHLMVPQDSPMAQVSPVELG